MSNTMSLLVNIIRDVLDEEDLNITRSTTTEDAENWDSLAQMQIVGAVESVFSISFSAAELDQLSQSSQVGTILDLINEKVTQLNAAHV